MTWALFTTAVVLSIRLYFWDNVSGDVIVWTAFGLLVSWLLGLVVRQGLIYTICWLLIVLFIRTARRQNKEYGDYDAP